MDAATSRALRRSVTIGLVLVAGVAFAGEPRWEQWGGADRAFRAPAAALATSWPDDGPPLLWTRTLGDGYAGVVGDRRTVYTSYRDGDDEVIVALDAADGTTRWSFRMPTPYRKGQSTQFGRGPNATPLIAGSRLVAISFTGTLVCLDRRDGRLLWRHELVEAFGARPLQFGYAASPLRLDDRVVVLVGGDRVGAAAFRLDSGEPAWLSPPFPISYGSPIEIRVGEQRQIVTMTPSGVIGLDADDGSLLWARDHENQFQTNCSGPWWDGETLFVSSQGSAGSQTFRLAPHDGRTAVVLEHRDPEVRVFHGSGVRRGDVLYAGGHEAIFAYDVRRARLLWRETGFPEASLVDVGERTLLLDENGTFALATLEPGGATIHQRAALLRKPAWTSPTPIGARVYLRGGATLLAVDLGEPTPPAGRRP